jgi:hypothetical protein
VYGGEVVAGVKRGAKQVCFEFALVAVKPLLERAVAAHEVAPQQGNGHSWV